MIISYMHVIHVWSYYPTTTTRNPLPPKVYLIFLMQLFFKLIDLISTTSYYVLTSGEQISLIFFLWLCLLYEFQNYLMDFRWAYESNVDIIEFIHNFRFILLKYCVFVCLSLSRFWYFLYTFCESIALPLQPCGA